MPAIQKKAVPCACTGVCTGYATRSNCPPLIVLAVAAVAGQMRGQIRENIGACPGRT